MIEPRQAVLSAVKALDAALDPVSRRVTIEGVHLSRVAARRVVDTLSAFDLHFPVLEQRAALLKDALGKVRDLHVSGHRHGPELSQAGRELKAAIVDWRHLRPAIDREIRSRPATASPPRKLLHHRLRKLEQRLDALPRKAPPRKAHQLRVKTKRAQTAVELMAPTKTDLLKRLKKASKLLGRLHDRDAGLVHGPSRKELVHEVTPALHKLRRALP